MYIYNIAIVRACIWVPSEAKFHNSTDNTQVLLLVGAIKKLRWAEKKEWSSIGDTT